MSTTRQFLKGMVSILAPSIIVAQTFGGSASSDIERVALSNNCYNAFSININYPIAKAQTLAAWKDKIEFPSIETQIQGKTFLLFIQEQCANTGNLKITLINKKTGKELDASDYSLETLPRGFLLAKTVVKNVFPDLLVHFSYDIIEGQAAAKCTWTTNSAPTCTGSAKPIIVHKEENSTDDFAVRPDKLYIHVNNSDTFVGKNLMIVIKAVGYNGNISTNYTKKSEDLDVYSTDVNTYLNYSFIIRNGVSTRNIFYFSRSTDNSKIEMKEITGKEWAIVDADDTPDSRRLFSGESNSIKVNDTSKSWAGVGLNESPNTTKEQTIQSDIRSNVNKNIEFNKMGW